MVRAVIRAMSSGVFQPFDSAFYRYARRRKEACAYVCVARGREGYRLQEVYHLPGKCLNDVYVVTRR